SSVVADAIAPPPAAQYARWSPDAAAAAAACALRGFLPVPVGAGGGGGGGRMISTFCAYDAGSGVAVGIGAEMASVVWLRASSVAADRGVGPPPTDVVPYRTAPTASAGSAARAAVQRVALRAFGGETGVDVTPPPSARDLRPAIRSVPRHRRFQDVRAHRMANITCTGV